MNRPQPEEYAPFYAGYIATVDDDVLTVLQKQSVEIPLFLRTIPAEKEDYAYAEGKWTLKEVLGHLMDTERIMTYRLLRFSRKDTQPVPGFDEETYIKNSGYAGRKFSDLIDEFEALRKSNLFLFRALNDDSFMLTGEANGQKISVRALLFVIAGHLNHHMQLIRERYL